MDRIYTLLASDSNEYVAWIGISGTKFKLNFSVVIVVVFFFFFYLSKEDEKWLVKINLLVSLN